MDFQLGRLIDIGAVRTWSLDGVEQSPATARAPSEVIARERYLEIYEQSLDLLMARRSLFLGGERALRFDGVTEIVVGKHAVMHALLAGELSAAGILHDQDSADGYARFLTDLLNPAGLVAQIANSVAIELDLPEASALPDVVYEDARRRLVHFRAYILERLRLSGPILLGDAALEELRAALVRDVVGAYNDYSAQRPVRRQAGSAWLRNLWRVRRLNPIGNERAGEDPLQVLYELKSVR